MTRRRFLVQGIVQGVGFRPFVARLARGAGLTGHVENTTRGVEVEVQGSRSAVDAFGDDLRRRAPAIAEIQSVDVSEAATEPRETGFEIRASRIDPVSSAIIPPDIATCPACRAELLDPGNRRFRYPFINCTDCGPRYTVIASLPYDRASTSLASFSLCADCAREYADAESRRFHAQPNACPACGPRLRLLGAAGEVLDQDPINGALETLRAGGVIALMGLGGFHLACDASQEGAVAALRRRKQRPAKPFAVMVADLETARHLAELSPDDEALLAGARAPILLAPARPASPLAPSVAPGQDRLGLFLPYTPLHHLLFASGGCPALVMTSGNRSDEPLLATAEEALARLTGVADRFVVHDRPILHRADDSVVKSLKTGPVVLRRARGYAPAPAPLANPSGRVVLALGAELASAVCVVRGDRAYLGPHVGDLKNLDVEEAFRAGIEHLLALLRVVPDLVVCDLHPAYRSSAHAAAWEARGVPLVRVQHHEAHAASCMAEHGFEGDALALALDGLGYGPDGTIWGGELLGGRPGRFERLGHLVPVPQPGGDRAAVEPWRMAASHLRRLVGADWASLPLPAFADRGERDRETLDRMITTGLQSPLTSSCGRLFDAAAAVLGFAGRLRYSAQAAMELEALAASCRAPVEPYPAGEVAGSRAGPLALDPGPLLGALLDDVLAGRDPGACALAFHRGLAGLFASAAAEASRPTGLRDVFLSGGCTQNAVFLAALVRELRGRGLRPHLHRQIPPNDGGVCFGQAAWALGSLRLTEPG
ncbi:MAG: carbamoyltransferase HypF [Deltaproteobacteria bacterium]|nr:carbamoyltransferase HypF [Deltaproteobacteria bacterium]